MSQTLQSPCYRTEPRRHEPAAELPTPEPPLRLCLMIDRLYPNGGTESQLIALIRQLDRRRVRPYLVLLHEEDGLPPGLDLGGCPVLRLAIRSFCRPRTLAAAFRLARFLRRERIDVMQVYFPESTYLGVPAAWWAGVPSIVRTRFNAGYWVTPLHRVLGRLCNLLAGVTVTNCDAARQSVLADEHLSPERVLVLENGVDLERFPYPRPRSGTIPGRRVGVVANLRPVKNLDLLVRAAAELRDSHPDVSFAVAGEGSERATLTQLAAELGLSDRFHLPGASADVPGFLADLDVAVLCSRSEGMSNALLEYMAAGKPIVATAVGAAPRLIGDGVHGLLVPPGDHHALAAAVRRLLDDRALAERLGAAARRRVETDHSRAAMLRRFEAFFLSLKRR